MVRRFTIHAVRHVEKSFRGAPPPAFNIEAPPSDSVAAASAAAAAAPRHSIRFNVMFTPCVLRLEELYNQRGRTCLLALWGWGRDWPRPWTEWGEWEEGSDGSELGENNEKMPKNKRR